MGRPVRELLALPVRMDGIVLGRPVDLLVDEAGARAVGFELACGDGARRFLPFAVVEIRPQEIAVQSALVLLDERSLEYYRRGTRSVATVPVADPAVDADGYVQEARTAA